MTVLRTSFPAPDRQDTWHHHGDHDIIACVIAGAIQIVGFDAGTGPGRVDVSSPGD